MLKFKTRTEKTIIKIVSVLRLSKRLCHFSHFLVSIAVLWKKGDIYGTKYGICEFFPEQASEIPNKGPLLNQATLKKTFR